MLQSYAEVHSVPQRGPMFVCFFVWRFNLFTLQGGGKERRGETSMCGCLSPAPVLGTWPETQAVPWLGIELWPFGSQAHAQSTEPHQAGCVCFFNPNLHKYVSFNLEYIFFLLCIPPPNFFHWLALKYTLTFCLATSPSKKSSLIVLQICILVPFPYSPVKLCTPLTGEEMNEWSRDGRKAQHMPRHGTWKTKAWKWNRENFCTARDEGWGKSQNWEVTLEKWLRSRGGRVWMPH